VIARTCSTRWPGSPWPPRCWPGRGRWPGLWPPAHRGHPRRPAHQPQRGPVRLPGIDLGVLVTQSLAIETITILALLSWTVLAAATPGRQPGAATRGRASHCDHDSRAAVSGDPVRCQNSYRPSDLDLLFSALGGGRYNRPDQAQTSRPRLDQRVPETRLTGIENTSSEQLCQFWHGTGLVNSRPAGSRML
jgi:hypothetical protein